MLLSRVFYPWQVVIALGTWTIKLLQAPVLQQTSMFMEELLELLALPLVDEPPLVLLLFVASPVVLVWLELVSILMEVLLELHRPGGGMKAAVMVLPVRRASACIAAQAGKARVRESATTIAISILGRIISILRLGSVFGCKLL
jgi:hypothetical protein